MSAILTKDENISVSAILTKDENISDTRNASQLLENKNPLSLTERGLALRAKSVPLAAVDGFEKEAEVIAHHAGAANGG